MRPSMVVSTLPIRLVREPTSNPSASAGKCSTSVDVVRLIANVKVSILSCGNPYLRLLRAASTGVAQIRQRAKAASPRPIWKRGEVTASNDTGASRSAPHVPSSRECSHAVYIRKNGVAPDTSAALFEARLSTRGENASKSHPDPKLRLTRIVDFGSE